MKISILGTRGEVEESAPYHSRHSGVFLNNELMLDLGERGFLNLRPKWIFLTHLHPDHAFFVRRSAGPGFEAPIFAPEPYHGGHPKVKKIVSNTKIDRYDIKPIHTVHSNKTASQAYLVTCGGRRLLYTGDMVWIKKWYNRYLRDLDLVITEASFIRRNGMIRLHRESGIPYGHAGIPRIIRRFAPFCRHFVLMHYGAWFYRDVRKARRRIKQLAREHNVRIDAGYDGMELEI